MMAIKTKTPIIIPAIAPPPIPWLVGVTVVVVVVGAITHLKNDIKPNFKVYAMF